MLAYVAAFLKVIPEAKPPLPKKSQNPKSQTASIGHLDLILGTGDDDGLSQGGSWSLSESSFTEGL